MAEQTRPTSFQVVGGSLTLAQLGEVGEQTVLGLRTLDVADGQRVRCLKYEDGSPAMPLMDYVYVAGSPLLDNGGTILRKTDGSGVFRYIGIQQPDVTTYGAWGDGIHDDQPAFMRAAAVEKRVRSYLTIMAMRDSIEFILQGQIFDLGDTIIERVRSAAERSAGTSVNIIEPKLTYREHCKVIGGTLRANILDRGFVHGVYSAPTIYLATTTFEGVNFDQSLRICIYANTILLNCIGCTFGITGTSGTIHMHYRQNGQPLVGSNLTSNLNGFRYCRFFRAKGVEYAIELGDGFMNNFDFCDFETNNASVATINNKGSWLTNLLHCWGERNAGLSFLRLAMDTMGNLQGPMVQVLRSCWLKLDTSNTCLVNSATQNISVMYDNCAGSGFAGKVLTKVTGVADDTPRFHTLLSCDFVGWTGTDNIPVNSSLIANLHSQEISLRNSAGALNAKINTDVNRLNLRHDVGTAFQTLAGANYAQIVKTITGSQLRMFSQNGVEMKIQPPVDGAPGPAMFTTV